MVRFSIPLALVLAGLVVGCREPTQVRLELATDARCEDVLGTTITTGSLAEIEQRPPATETSQCAADTGRIGSLVVVPDDAKDGEFVVRVVTGFYKSPEQCVADGYVGGCIVARRILSFIPHTSIELPITLEAACIDVPCEATQTCRRGTCVDARIDDPLNCTDPAGCADEPGEGGAAGAPEQTAGAPPTGGSGGVSGAGALAGAGGSSASAAGEGGAPLVVEAGGAGGAPSLEPLHQIRVTTASDTVDGDVSSLAALQASPGEDAAISLREAIVAANATLNDGGPDQIGFALSGTPPYPLGIYGTPLPEIVEALDIDGESQPGYVSVPLVELWNGDLATGSGLVFAAGSDGSKLHGLAIGGFPEAGIVLRKSKAHVITSNYVGLYADGKKRRGNTLGILLDDCADSDIGGTLPLLGDGGNVFSANGNHGIVLQGAGTHGNAVLGNIVGLDAGGTQARGNLLNGIMLSKGASSNMIGGYTSEVRNVISANGGNGVRITDAATQGNIVLGNLIGSDVAFSADDTLGNHWAGVRLNNGAHLNSIGLGDPALGNRIWFNWLGGVTVAADVSKPYDNAILGNSIGHNTELGIQLGSDGVVTPNDAGDVDSGPNDLLNFPDLTAASYAPGTGSVTVSYSLDVPAGSYRVELFTSAAANASGHGEGEALAKAELVSHSGQGPQAFQASFPCAQDAWISATATAIAAGGGYLDTSEFSLAIPTTYP